MQPTLDPTCTYLERLTQPSVTCKLLNVQDSYRLKRLAAAVQLRPWPPFFSITCMYFINIHIKPMGGFLVGSRAKSVQNSSPPMIFLSMSCGDLCSQSAASKILHSGEARR